LPPAAPTMRKKGLLPSSPNVVHNSAAYSWKDEAPQMPHMRHSLT
jgi:hypothetical protein